MNRFSSLLIVLIILSGCTSLRSPDINGLIVDSETGKPINEARVYAEWKKVDGGPGGQISGGVVKELRLKTGQDGKFMIPSYLVINFLPYPLGQGGNFCIVVYAHGYKLERYNVHDPDNFESGIGDININNLYTFKMIALRDPVTFDQNYHDIHIAELDYELEEFKYFVNKYPSNEKVPGYMLGIGTVYQKMNENNKAIEEYDLICKQYAKSDACNEAKSRIEKLSRSAHHVQ